MGFTKGQPKVGGRKAGTPNKVTAARAETIAKVEERAGRPLAVARISEIADFFYGMAARYAPNRERAKDDPFPVDEAKSAKYMDKAGHYYAELAPYQSPKLQSTTIRDDGPREPIHVTVRFV